MEQKVNFLLDRSHEFDPQQAALLDELTLAIRANAPNVSLD